MGQDTFDDFSFQPITEGLGFHKKKLQIDEKALRDIRWKADVELPEISFIEDGDREERVAAHTTTEPSLDFNAYPSRRLNLIDDEINLDKVRSELQKKAKLSKTLPRKDMEKGDSHSIQPVETIKTTKASSSFSDGVEPSVAESIQDIQKIEGRLKESREAKENLKNTSKITLDKRVGNWFSAIIDFVVIFGVINLFLSCLLLVTKLDVFAIAIESINEPMTQFSLLTLAIGSCFLYMVSARSLLGCTLGDWALDMQVGTKEDHKKASFPFRVAWRFLVNLCFGFFLLPVLSVIFRVDLAGKISGLNLYELED